MKIISLEAENIKRLVAVEITPDGNLVQITGENGAGKTSVLDSIWWALAGATHIQSVPIRTGEDKAFIRLDLGELIVTRVINRREDGPTTTLTVETAEGARYPSPQRMLDDLVGALSFDPLAFVRMAPKSQFEALRRFVPGVDFDAVDDANKADFDARTEANRIAKAARAAAEHIVVPADLPEQPIDEAALVAEMQEAAERNADLERQRMARENRQIRVASDLAQAAEIRSGLGDAVANIQNRATVKVRELEAQVAAIKQQAVDDETRVRTNRAEEARLLEERAAADRAEDIAPLPDPISLDALRAGIDQARIANAGIARRAERQKLEWNAKTQEAEAAALTKAIADRNKERDDKIAAAKMPVEGLGFGEDGVITFDGVPFDQASDAQQLRVGVALAMAEDPRLRVIRVRDGSLLDERSLRLLGELADLHDCQVWIERVDTSGKVGFVISDGQVLGATPKAKPAAKVKGKARAADGTASLV